MKFFLGVEQVTAINDGGLGLRWYSEDGPIDWQHGGVRPVLSLEVTNLHSV